MWALSGRGALLLALLGAAVAVQELPTNGLNGHSLHPPYFNLAEGTRIWATATCGEEEGGRALPDLYCKLVGGPAAGDPGQTIQGQYCDVCTSADIDKAHPITNAIDGTERWWQSPPLSRTLEYNEINVTLDLGQLFHVAYVLIKFANSPRPDLWVLERSTDFGGTYQPWQYFASSKRDCIERFGPRTVERIVKDDDVICTSEYSRIVPLENGEIVVSLVNGRPGAMNFSYSPLLRNFTKATNIRLRFLRTNTLLGHLMGKALKDPTVTRRYYYSIKDISIGGRCVCHGHADACDARDPIDPFRLHCDCQHNTCGGSCDSCCPGFNQLPWKPATADSANECELCQCHGHAQDCYYDPEVERRKASLNHRGHYEGGGVCVDCQHHTTGINCERCSPGYYKSPDHPINSPHACARCHCDSEFLDGTCEDLTGRCYCKPNYTGENCDVCAEGYADFPDCNPAPPFPEDTGEQILPAGEIINCDCNAAGTVGNACRKDAVSGLCLCKPGFQGLHCEACVPGSHGPGCQVCGCSVVGTLPEGCDPAGRCICKPEYDGAHCDQCTAGYHSYPNCQVCSCDARGSADDGCSPSGHCRCHSNYVGLACDQCAPGFHGYPHCTPCQCSAEGSLHGTCDQETGQCSCRSRVTGTRCEACVPGAYGFPHCEVGSCNPSGSALLEPSPAASSCECRMYVEGPACDRCKPLHWNLTPENPYGCSGCQCSTAGTLSGIAECEQGTGQCFCKPNVCSRTCSMCKSGFFTLDHNNYFGCRGCRCDIGGALGLTCDERTGACQCRENVQGPRCNQPESQHYFPDLHHLKFELEEGRTPDGRAVRFGYNPLEFESFSWRGYAQMSGIQPKVVVTLHVSSPDLFRIAFRYANRGPTSVEGRVSVLEEDRFKACDSCAEQTQPIVFPPSTEPAFVSVPQSGYGEPFVLNPNTWSLVIEAEGILLDYLVLLPSAYYEAPILQLKVTEPCTYTLSPGQSNENCLLYQFLPVDGFPSASGSEGTCRLDNGLPRPCPTEHLTPRHPPMVACSGSDVEIQFRLAVPQPGQYLLLLEYANEESLQEAGIAVTSPRVGMQHGAFIFYPCSYSFLCRGLALDSQKGLIAFELTTEANIRVTADRAQFLLDKVILIPYGEFTLEFTEPKIHCISTHGTFSPSSGSCLPSRFQKPPRSMVLAEGQLGTIPAGTPLSHGFTVTPAEARATPQPPSTVVDSKLLLLLQFPQTGVVYNSRIQTLGRYAFILHYYQPGHPTFQLEVLVNGGRVWQGLANATFCPHAHGCRSLVVSENQIVLDVTDNDLSVTVRVPEGRMLWLEYVLVVPEDSYNANYLVEEPMDKSYNFISNCGVNSFHINPLTSSTFCQASAISLSLFYNNGAQPCNCHEAGTLGTSCEPFGGQCACRSNVIGRDCSRCATGYWGFPNCRPCDCGPRLCDELTGRCICPPLTEKPECTVCQPQTFGCHPLVGCEECNCSRVGVQEQMELGCDLESGQCTCKPNVVGRQCERCAPGYYDFPNCRRCDCHQEGTEPGICDSVTGQCHCKENVEGLKCEQCKLGTFYLDAGNPKGCTRCFCFGATDRCHISSKSRAELVDMSGWALLSTDRQQIPLSFSLEEGLVEADLRDVPDVYQELYWHAPDSYLGDRVSAYGGFLRYHLHAKAIRGDAAFIPVESRPDVILKGNQMSIAFLESAYPTAGDHHQGQIQLVESNFRHTRTHNPVSREELMMVLSKLQQLHIRALNAQSSSSVSLRRVVLEVASETGLGHKASNMELCMCPANYRGDSCQECAPGYYRDTKGLFLGKCVPCNCSGRSDQCLPGSGVCVNCQYNTEGEHCERCREGFVMNATAEKLLHCVGCPCPLSVASNNFAIGCVHKPLTTQCLCMPGYAGPRCERCAPGYYGNPMVIGSSCRPCDCSANADPNLLFSECDPLTGVCMGCMFNTAGARCEICAPGYYGDAVGAKNCTKCSCSPCGAASCDPQTGQCLCKPGVTGQRCDTCQAGYYGYDGCAGCRRCECDAASVGTTCHPQSGQCDCQHGVNGLRCQQCAPGYWGFGASGCRKCQCKGGSCDPRTGECTCMTGLTGKQCDTCLQKYEIPVAHGPDAVRCEPCDSCVLLLLHDLERMGDLFPGIRAQLSNLSASSIAWARLHGLNSSIENAANLLLRYQSSMKGGEEKAGDLEEESRSVARDLDSLHEKVTAANRKASSVGQKTEETHEEATDLLKNLTSLQQSILGLKDQMGKIGTSESEGATPSEEFWQKMAEVEKLMTEMKARDFSDQKGLADTELEKARTLLDQVKNEMSNKSETNQDLLNNIKDRLAKHSSELMDLRDALNEAVNKTRQTDDMNSLNQNHLEETQQRRSELQRRYNQLRNAVRMAEEALVQVSDLLQMIEDIKEMYEKLAASLDGARSPLLEKVKKFSPASSKIPIVEEAEEHVRLLNQVALNLSSIIRDTNQDGLIQRAINASNAYASIIDAVKNAEKAANGADQGAKAALTDILSDDLAKKAKDLRKKGSALVETTEEDERKLTAVVKETLKTTKDRLTDAKMKKERLLQDLRAVQDKLNAERNDSAVTIQAAKLAAMEANSTASRLENTLYEMKRNLDQWKEKYGDIQSEDMDQAVQEAKTSVSNLESTIPQLLEKLSSLENHRSQNASVSNNILRIRQLISQARNAASKVKVPMRFNGTSGVRLRTPSNVRDLAAYTSLKFHIQNPEPKSKQKRQAAKTAGHFVLYLGPQDALGDYMGVVMKDAKVQWVYKLGEEEPTLLTVDEDIDEQFAAISIERILQYGHMSVTVEKKTLHETKGDSRARGQQGLLNLEPNRVVFYVGGYPSSFTPPDLLDYPNYRGCIEMDTLNEEVISLYNFKETFQVDTIKDKPCARSKSTGDPWITDGSYFDGTGYAEIKLESQISSTKRFEQEIRVVSYNGIIFLLENEGQFLCLAVQDGKLVVYYDFDEGIQMAKSAGDSASLAVSSAAHKVIQIILLSISGKKRFFIRLERMTMFTVDHDAGNFKLDSATSYYLGGAPESRLPSSLKKIFPHGASVRGCMKGLKALGKYVDLKRTNTAGVSYGCTLDLLIARSVMFHGHGFLTMSLKSVPSLQENFYTGFGFRTSQNNGLLYHRTTEEGTCQVSIRNGRIAVKILKTELSSKDPYADDVSHYVAIYSNEREVQLYVDDQLQARQAASRKRRHRRQDDLSLITLGGFPEPGAIASLSGCISNVFVRRKAEAQTVVDLQQNTQSANVTMSCQSSEQPQRIRVQEKTERTSKARKGRRQSRDKSCHVGKHPKAIQGAFQFGGSPASHLQFGIPASFQERSRFSMDVRLNSSNGLLFYVASEQETSYMALFVTSGRFVLLVDSQGDKVQVRSKDRWNDGWWHSVFFSRERDKIHLVVDGLRAQSKTMTFTRNFTAQSPFYVGGVPAGIAKARVPEASRSSFNVCMKKLQINGQPLNSPDRVFGVTPCYEGVLQDGVYFAADGGYLMLENSVAIGDIFQLMLEVRPQTSSGLVFHVAGKTGPYLTVHADNREVTVNVNIGAGEFSTSVTLQQSLCDGQWHSIAVIKGNNMIQLDVDTQGNQTVGPGHSHSSRAKATLYVAGTPDTLYTAAVLPASSSPPHPFYVGCIRNLLIDRNPIDMSRTGSAGGFVGVNGCPAL
ncbi:laminin subunit alpha-5 isoform X2 [Rhinatrema bivittatum]|uniref:laminin subunit alpha-5 isoform X2 n=1 Tax=Rhinatrema bivittatum TaxID=194408 RepID=UPI00112E447B|nr:laminin subunit alpha-5 isoform X2 [Rhinatrema bivittatum]